MEPAPVREPLQNGGKTGRQPLIDAEKAVSSRHIFIRLDEAVLASILT